MAKRFRSHWAKWSPPPGHARPRRRSPGPQDLIPEKIESVDEYGEEYLGLCGMTVYYYLIDDTFNKPH